jgi:glycosyltransferase involved in cell wall biosynthesis
MRVLHVAEAFSSGILPIIARIADELVGHGHETGIAFGVRPETPTDPSAAVAPGVELFPMPWKDRSPGQQLAAGRALRRLTREYRPDVIHLHSSFAGAVGSLALRRAAPLIYTPHGYSFTMSDKSAPVSAAFRIAERVVAHRVDVVAAISESEATLARDIVHAPRVTMVRNGIPELDDLPAPRERTGRPEIYCVGRISPPRPPEPAAEILSAVADVADVAWLGGETSGREGTALLEAAGIPVTGWLPREAALDRLAGATACLHWAAWDGLPVSVLEALARDVVVVASDIPANREILGAGQVCATPAEAAALLRTVVTDGAVRERLLGVQRERRVWFGAARMAREWLMLYTRLLKEGRSPAENRL